MTSSPYFSGSIYDNSTLVRRVAQLMLAVLGGNPA